MIDLDISTLTMLLLVVLIALVLGATVGWITFQIRVGRLPAATRLANVEEQLAIKQEALERKEQDLRELDQKIAERDRHAAEAAALREQIEELRAQLANLEPAREDIEATLNDAAEAAGKLAEANNALRDAEQKLADVNRDLDPERIERLTRDRENAESELERVKVELDRLHTDLAPLRAERDTALRIVAEAAQYQARAEALKIELEELDNKRHHLTEERDRLRGEVELEHEELSATRNAILSAEAERDLAQKERAQAEEAHQALTTTAYQLETRIASLKNELKGLADGLRPGAAGQEPVGPLTPEQRKALLADLVTRPDCLAAPARLGDARNPELEHDALYRVRTHLQDAGLQFSDRVLRAFHTALKINDTAQITVLAGVSGTGKSLLPRRYAEAMGIHFLQVPVEPRWDSPQDLLGFYNYVERKYRATELARLMASMDPWDAVEHVERNYSDHVAMVLLDEMNLARVEYYFSEFLSRLEVRPRYAGGWAAREACKDALIPVDIRGMENPPYLFPGQNILFVGTMNDDESTQSLSDKVLDRGNVLQFPAPNRFPETRQAGQAVDVDALRFASWRSWVRGPESLDGAAGERATDVIGRLASIMDGFGKPFGHRMNQSIRHYLANYPTEGMVDTDAALADQIEFRILPKLRGVEITNHARQFEELETLIGATLGDTALANRIRQLQEEQENRTGQFVWRGLERG
ncbi:MAG: AAA family ATPase [Rhodobacteraceae bacterium]|nr:AAA family ATPase [Paracoccaceae bacterium]